MASRYTDLTALLLRLAFGGMMLPHGVKKLDLLQNGLADVRFADPIGLGAPTTLVFTLIIELLLPVLVMAGVKVRITTVPLMVTMLIAAFVVHAADPFAKKEPALLFFSGYLAIWLLGAGKYSFAKWR
jgi:putative oxidoreductase